ncbi:translation initiation factor IF-2 [Dysosmobacter sp.]|uniref:translation initiation factor IF-2 n=1 Tax=Dysosmobacter sp. TaxID=2591382 RepID=UPI002A8DB4DD|nr:translation initiation factor IF-2 [Dysosmobacter sp.]MDY3984000.1 translation initiation factor IF-2 [Dysosmobacter sp.]
MEKYRVHEVAKDFGLPTKTITEILTKYVAAPKNHMQVLTDHELSVIFDYLTQHNQVSGIQVIFADTAKKEEAPAPAPKAAPAPAASAQQQAKPAQQAAAPAAPAKQAAPQAQQPTTRVPQKKIVDTRKGGDVNLAKYDERLEDLGGERGQRMQQRGGKEKFRNNNQRKGNMTFSNKRRQDEAEKMRKLQLEIAKKAPVKVSIPDEISVGELASRMKKTGAEVVKCLMKNGVMASLSQIIDFDTAAIIAEELGCKVEHEVTVTIEEKLIDDHEDKPEDLVPRAPVVVVMGHVDHGKTSLLDYIRHANVVSGEAGGITQHIGAYTVEINGSPITFLDTPGHEAFTSMRARGAMVTDIAILVVAADDGIMPQTVESINHAKAANIPVVVAINKMDTVGANPERIKQQLTEYDLVSEEWGGDTIICPISAKTGMGIDNLLENLVILAEVQELKANPNRAARGAVIEARLDKGRGPIMTVLVQNGTLKLGDIIIAGTAVGRVRTMINDKGQRVTEAGPSTPVEISGMSEVPSAGDTFNAVADERMARELAEERRVQMANNAMGGTKKVSLEDLFSQIQAGEMKTLNIIVKADVQGSAEAVKTSLEKISNDEVRVKVIHSAVGAINESDVMLAATSGAIIVGFNVRPDNAARDSAARSKVDMRMYRVIYDCINEIEAAMKGMLAPQFKEVIIGHAEVRETYKVSKVGTVCGCYCTDGKIQRGCDVRVLRDNIVIHEGSLASLRRFKDDVKEVASGYECGMQVEKFNDIKPGDIIECFVMEQIDR